MLNVNTSYPAVLMLASARHDAPYASTAYALAKEMARTRPVFFIDNPFSWKDFFSPAKKRQIEKRYTSWGKIKKHILKPEPQLPGLHVVVSPLIIPANFLPEGKVYDRIRQLNLRLLGRMVRKLLQEQGITEYMFFNSFNPYYWRLPDHIFRPQHKVYQTVDRIAHAPYLKKHGPRLEEEAMAQADLGLTTSRFLKKLYQGKGNVHCLPNAADVALFKTAAEKQLERPADWPVPAGQAAVIYTGHFDLRSDLRLIEEVCRRLPEIAFVFLGPQSGEAANWAKKIRLNNLKFIGKKNLAELPAYLQQAQLAIIPFQCNALTQAIYPLKINEYLAAGLPVVATPFSEDILSFGELISLEDSAEGWVKSIQQGIENDSAQARQRRSQFAEQNTWEARTVQFWQLYVQELKKETKTISENATTV